MCHVDIRFRITSFLQIRQQTISSRLFQVVVPDNTVLEKQDVGYSLDSKRQILEFISIFSAYTSLGLSSLSPATSYYFLKWHPCYFPVMALSFVVLIYLSVFQ